VADAIGYRAASVGDLWSGNSYLNPKVTKEAQRLLMGAFGKDAYRYLVRGEQVIQGLVADAKTTIVVRSVVVPAVNFLSNIYQMISRGIPIAYISKMMPRMLNEARYYTNNRLRLNELEAELRAAETNEPEAKRLRAKIQVINDQFKRLSIWPLIEAGEFSSISETGLDVNEALLADGKLSDFIERQVDKLPPSVRTLAKYGIVSKDTALYKGLQRSVEYGDFMAKAILYHHLIGKKGLSQKDALARVTEEYVNYDRLPGRQRGYAESIGLLWFWNFKIRILKVAINTLRNNPLHLLLASMLPAPTMFGTVGLPTDDNILTGLVEGKLDNSVGPGQGLRAWSLNPWWNLFT
jgi:hypothetical protein